jgi:hypothetical protein
MNPLRKVFRSSHVEIWRQLADELGARYVGGSTWKGDRIEAEHGEWSVTLDHVTFLVGNVPVTFTRYRAPYVNPDAFRFTVYRRGLASDVAKWFGMQDVAVGHAAFDRDFIVKGTDEHGLRRLLDDAKLRSLLERQEDVHLEVKDHEGWFGKKYPPATDLLECRLDGLVTDKQRLKDAFELFGRTLDRLCQIGSAYEDDPGVEL